MNESCLSMSQQSMSESSALEQDLWVGHYVEKTAEEKQWECLSEEERLAEANRILSSAQKSYHGNYVWGQLVYWFHQTSNDYSLR